MQSTLRKSTPQCGIELEHGVVVSLTGGIVFDAPVALVPGAGRCGVGGVSGMEIGAGDGQIGCDDLAGNAADDVNAELESLRVHPVGQRLESGAVGGGGKSVRRESADRCCSKVLSLSRLWPVGWPCTSPRR